MQPAAAGPAPPPLVQAVAKTLAGARQWARRRGRVTMVCLSPLFLCPPCMAGKKRKVLVPACKTTTLLWSPGPAPAGADQRQASAGLGQPARNSHPHRHRLQLVLWSNPRPDAQPVRQDVHRQLPLMGPQACWPWLHLMVVHPSACKAFCQPRSLRAVEMECVFSPCINVPSTSRKALPL